jgi:predicted DNA-binding protein
VYRRQEIKDQPTNVVCVATVSAEAQSRGAPSYGRRPEMAPIRDKRPFSLAFTTHAAETFFATQVCYSGGVATVTSSFRMSKELRRELSEAAQRTGKGKTAIIIEALAKHLHTMKRESLAGEARRQSELVSTHERDADWYGLADTTGWK